MMIRVFIENEKGSNKKNIYNEKTLEFKKSYTVSRDYPYYYGFILDTTSGDGDNLDCFILIDKQLESGDIVDCEPIGLMIQREDNQSDNNVLAVLHGEQFGVNDQVKENLKDFVSHVFDHLENKRIEVGDFYDKTKAEELISDCLDNKNKNQ